VYLPVTPADLRKAREAGRFEPPLAGHAVTEALAHALAGADDEELEYAAMTAAAVDALALLGVDDRPRRLVAAVDAASWTVSVGPDAADSAVEVTVPVPFRRLAAVHADSEDAGPDVRTAVEAQRAVHGGEDAAEEAAAAGEVEAAVERCLDRELGWYAAQELDLLLD
jgi:hypothetical protein